jgi:tetratricopeptide (TPR) repeat protein
MSPSDTYVYSNPYWDDSYATTSYVDYSQPIQAPPADVAPPGFDPAAATDAGAAAAPAPAPEEEDPQQKAAIAIFDQARELFKQQKYAEAQAKVEEALKILPADATLHEFRALTLFAQKKYKEAASAVYAVLNAGPPWNWDTMRALYADPNTYTAQLRDLETYIKQNPQSAPPIFLVSYHYLVGGHPDAARKGFEQAAKMEPNDKLSAQLAQSLTPPPGETGQPPAAKPS